LRDVIMVHMILFWLKAGSGSAHNGISVSDGGLEEVSKNTLVVQYNNIEDLQKTIQKIKILQELLLNPY
jgi:Glutamate-1-semialdehyde aminotransferase